MPPMNSMVGASALSTPPIAYVTVRSPCDSVAGRVSLRENFSCVMKALARDDKAAEAVGLDCVLLVGRSGAMTPVVSSAGVAGIDDVVAIMIYHERSQDRSCDSC